jgi:hypothetical protein
MLELFIEECPPFGWAIIQDGFAIAMVGTRTEAALLAATAARIALWSAGLFTTDVEA